MKPKLADLILAQAIEREHRAQIAEIEAERLEKSHVTREASAAHGRAALRALRLAGRRLLRELPPLLVGLDEKGMRPRIHSHVYATLTRLSQM